MNQQPAIRQPPQQMTYICAGTLSQTSYVNQSLPNYLTITQCLWPSQIDCGSENQIKPREPIRCQDCGHRIMYKKRTRRIYGTKCS
ncbi:LOW QUALITY PROTEIN: hypothetical protein BC936DRAFT_137080 [Jimgerdemannia flammicorona]|uniref:DNA directed RNA polymerase n=1 Tax=Jimgerdemannia flammicorona TaxID=994334 RepID=A0A433CY32_9FUNG|nr:LOW QUALITY PROTEIN: hypothetical protein BC936DRAFT_137080 [Jimgerdemannia flammicorona]